MDADGSLSFVSPVLEKRTGVAPETVLQRSVGDLLHRAADGRRVLPAELRMSSPVLLRLVAARPGDEIRDVEVTSNPLADGGRVLSIRDVTERRRLEAEITHRAYYDSVTGLPNRVQFLERLANASVGSR